MLNGARASPEVSGGAGFSFFGKWIVLCGFTYYNNSVTHMRKIPYLLMLCLLAMTVTRAQVKSDSTILTYFKNNTATYGVKIITNLPFTNGSQMPTIILEGYCYGVAANNTQASIGILLNYYIYNNGFINYRASSFGSYLPVIKLANENGKVVIFLDAKDYYLRLNVRAFAAGMTEDIPANYAGWTATDAALTGTPVVTVPYVNSFGGRVAIVAPDANAPVPQPQAALHVTNAVPSGSDGITAILGNNWRHFTHFGSPNGGRIRGADSGYLVVESNPAGANRNLYLNLQSNGNILMARGGWKRSDRVRRSQSRYQSPIQITSPWHHWRPQG